MQLSSKDLNVMQVLAGLENCNSISKASEEVGIKPGTGRNVIANAEHELGVELVDSVAFDDI